MIAVDSSALVAIALDEPERRAFMEAIQGAEAAWMSPINYVETGTILVARGVHPDQSAFDAWLAGLDVGVRDHLSLTTAALAAYLQYGKGFSPARLNLADCFAYALAKALDAPLLFKGDDFGKTDIRSAV